MKYKEVAEHLRPLLGKELLDFEVHETDGPSDCGPEVVLHFPNGQELSIYVHPETGLTVERD